MSIGPDAFPARFSKFPQTGLAFFHTTLQTLNICE